MATINSWEKLCKAQSDYPKPKFAVGFVDKALKKNSLNPYLLLWRTDLFLQQHEDPVKVFSRIQEILKVLGPLSTELLSYLYRLGMRTIRRLESSLIQHASIGTEIIKTWTNSAKTLQKADRLCLWDALFDIAYQENCWEDVRFAVVEYKKEDTNQANKKAITFALIAANMHSAYQKKFVAAPAAELQLKLARAQINQAFKAAPEDPIAIKDIRDLRFMATVYAQQEDCNELFTLWDNPPAHLSGIMKTHHDDLTMVKLRILLQNQRWTELEKLCFAEIESVRARTTIAQKKTTQPSKPLLELCAWRWDIWRALRKAITEAFTLQESVICFRAIKDSLFGTQVEITERPVMLAYLDLQSVCGLLSLSDCMEYWKYHSKLLSCFEDLRKYVEMMAVRDIDCFMRDIVKHTKSAGLELKENETSIENWKVMELNVLKFQYMFTGSLWRIPSSTDWQNFAIKSIKFLELSDMPDAAILAIYALQQMHHIIIYSDYGKTPFETTINTRMLLQLTMLARYVISRDAHKENRALCLLAARLHLNLGLGKCAFRAYNDARCKEMLLDTISPWILSNISLTHPFECKGYQGFSADAELEKVIKTIKRMELKARSSSSFGITAFPWDQAADSATLHHKLLGSSTKHLCTAERRNAVRLRGEPTESLPQLGYQDFAFYTPNVDWSIFPSYETQPYSDLIYHMLCPASIRVVPSQDYYDIREICNEMLLSDSNIAVDHWRIKPILENLQKKRPEPNDQPCDQRNDRPQSSAMIMWQSMTSLVMGLQDEEIWRLQAQTANHVADYEKLVHELQSATKAMKNLRMPPSTSLKSENQDTLFHENMLLFCYSKLEALRALTKFIEMFPKKAMSIKSASPLKTLLTKKAADQLQAEVEKCYTAVRELAESYITLVRRVGLSAIKAQVRWGGTGEALRSMISDQTLEVYAKDYVDSALEAWSGVLRVRLR